jgi:hypothetical protein
MGDNTHSGAWSLQMKGLEKSEGAFHPLYSYAVNQTHGVHTTPALTNMRMFKQLRR